MEESFAKLWVALYRSSGVGIPLVEGGHDEGGTIGDDQLYKRVFVQGTRHFWVGGCVGVCVQGLPPRFLQFWGFQQEFTLSCV